MRRGAALIALAAALLCALAPAGASAAAPDPAPLAASSCPSSLPYPGDAAAKEDIAAWMGARAIAAGLPPELPVMAALVESNLTNVDDPRSGYAGYFQMSRRYFDTGPYAGFPDRPELQIGWFTETATSVREARLDAGKPDPLADDSAWGEWIADVEKPAAQYRDRYQLRLADAREILGSDCAGAPPASGDGGELALWGGTEQALRRKVRVAVVCASACQLDATGTLRMPGAGSAHVLGTATGTGAAEEKVRLALTLPRSALKAARRAIRRGELVRARIDVSAVGADGAEASARRNVRLG